MNEPNIYMADIKNKIYEAGLLRSGEKIVLTAAACVQLEHYTGKTYSYRMLDLQTLKAKHLFSRQKPLTDGNYQKAIEKMLAIAVHTVDVAEISAKERAARMLTYIFTDILPLHGMALRENQLSLALSMLSALQENKLALCEAEVGTGKTHAYILAVAVHNLFIESKQPAIISISTIALQKALTEEYIPQISDILMAHRIMDMPLTFIVRKGKTHFACDSKVRDLINSLLRNNDFADQQLIQILTGLHTGAFPIDLDKLPLTEYVKKRICVEHCHLNCDLSSVCRYRTYIRRCLTSSYDFQIPNHNLVLADILSRKGGRRKLFPDYGTVIFDEAHKLLDTAQGRCMALTLRIWSWNG